MAARGAMEDAMGATGSTGPGVGPGSDARPMRLRVHEDAVGISHFGSAELPMALTDFSPPAPPVQISGPLEASRALWYRGPAGWFGDWHPAPHRQLLVQLSGAIEILVGDGERRIFGPGSCVLLEDVSGRGHVTRLRGPQGAGFLSGDLDEAEEIDDPWSVTGLFVQLP